MSEGTPDPEQLLAALRCLPDDYRLPLLLTVGQWVGLLESVRCGPPEWLSTRQAADLIGWTPKDWRRWAKDGRIEGAVQDDRDRWKLPREACRAYVTERFSFNREGRRGPHKRRSDAGRSSSA